MERIATLEGIARRTASARRAGLLGAWGTVAAIAVLCGLPPGPGAADEIEQAPRETLAAVVATPVAGTDDLDIAEATVTYLDSLDLLVFALDVKDTAGGTKPKPRGRLDGAGVIAYLFPTTLAPADVGLADGPGTVALAVTAHPDFDDTPLWDENGNRRYDDDGDTWHAHWVLLAPDKRTPTGLAVLDVRSESAAAGTRAPTAPDMPVALDSPGFPVRRHGSTLEVLVPIDRVGRRTKPRFDAMAAYLQVSTAPGAPMLGVYEVYDRLSSDGVPHLDVKRR